MEKKVAGLLAVAASLTACAAANAAPVSIAQSMPAADYADLLTPIPNAVALLKADDAAREATPGDATVQLARYHHHHHHHHHHRYFRRRLVVPFVTHRRHHHHHHHHHHHNWR